MLCGDEPVDDEAKEAAGSAPGEEPVDDEAKELTGSAHIHPILDCRNLLFSSCLASLSRSLHRHTDTHSTNP